MNEKEPTEITEEERIRRTEELKRYHKASVYDYTPDSPEERHFLDWEGSFNKRLRAMKAAERGEPSDPEKKEEALIGAAERISQISSLIDSVQLSPEVSDDNNMKKGLEKNKATAKSLIKDLLGKEVREYVNLVRSFEKKRERILSGEITADELQETDQSRKLKHDALISSINIVNRFLTQKFGTMTEDSLDEYEENEEKAGRLVIPVDRVPLPKNIICPAYTNLSNREDITDWAFEVYRSLDELSL